MTGIFSKIRQIYLGKFGCYQRCEVDYIQIMTDFDQIFLLGFKISSQKDPIPQDPWEDCMFSICSVLHSPQKNQQVMDPTPTWMSRDGSAGING